MILCVKAQTTMGRIIPRQVALSFVRKLAEHKPVRQLVSSTPSEFLLELPLEFLPLFLPMTECDLEV